MCGHMCAVVYVWRSVDNLLESVCREFWGLNSGHRGLVVGQYPQSHLARTRMFTVENVDHRVMLWLGVLAGVTQFNPFYNCAKLGDPQR